MADFLKDLPCYNKENFANFQPNYNRLQNKTQSLFRCTNEYADPQIIVNQKYNIVVKYLEKSVFNDKPVVLNSNKKRENNSNNDEQMNETKSFKRLKTTNDLTTTMASSHSHSIGNTLSSSHHHQSSNETILIEIDEVDEDDEDDNQIDDV